MRKHVSEEVFELGNVFSQKESEFLPRRITKFSACGGLFCCFDWSSPSTARTSEGSTSRTRIFYKLLCLGTLSDAKNHKIARPSAPRRSAEPISSSKRYNGRGKLWSVVSMLKEISATLLDSRQSAGHDDTGCVLRSKLLPLVLTSYQIS